MVNRLAKGIVRTGRVAVSAVGLAVVLALVLGVATTALAGTGVGATFNLGKVNSVSALSTLVGSTASSMLKVDNNGSGAALDLQVGPSTTPPADKTVAPMKVDSQAKVANLNADEIDGMDSAQFAPLGGFQATEVIDVSGPLPREGFFTSNGGTLLISASGSGYRSSTDTTTDAGRVGMRVLIDGQLREGVEAYTNDADSHKAFVSNNFVVTNLAAGTHKITLERAWDSQLCGTQDEWEFVPCTTTDGGDNFHVSVLEIPK